MDAEIYELFASKLNKMKKVGGENQYVGLCPYHDDKNASFSVNVDTGLWNCKTCCEKGNAYKFASDMNHPNPKQFINENDSTYRVSQSNKIVKNGYDHTPYNDSEMKSYITNMDAQLIPSFVDPQLVNDLGIGFNDTTFVFAYKDLNDKIVGHKVHKSYQRGQCKAHWYPRPKIASFKRNKPLYICEGEKDVLPLLSLGYNAITGTGGCGTIPKDIEWIKDWDEWIYICYDNDDGGRNGANKLGKFLKETYPHLKVKIIKWSDNLPNKFDVWDAFNKQDNAMDWFDAVENAVEVKVTETKPTNSNGFQTFKLGDFLMEEYTPTTPVIESIAYNNQTTLIFGDTGSKKSFIALQCALSIASGVPLFEHFKTTKKKVVVIQFENENFDMQSRLSTMLPYFIKKSGNSDWVNDIDIVPLQRDNDQFVNNWIKIDETLERLNLDNCVMILDNLYTSTDKELSDNHEATRLLQEVNRVKVKHNGTFIMIGHSTKGVVLQKQLDKDQSQGGKTIVNWMANVVSVDYSRISQDLNIMKIVKGGRSDKNELLGIAFKLHWSDDSCTFKKGAIIKNEAIHFTGDTEKWEITLIKEVASQPRIVNSKTFDRMMFKEALPQIYQDMNDTKISRLLIKLNEWGLIKKLDWNKYQIDRGNLSDFCE